MQFAAMGPSAVGLCAFLTLLALATSAQTTQGLISGRVVDEVDRRPIAGAVVDCDNEANNLHARTTTNNDGFYALPLLPPGIYEINVNAGPRYRRARISELELPVAGFLEQNFTLRLLTDIWQRGQSRSVFPQGGNRVVVFYGPDVDTSRWVQVLPLGGVRGNLEPSLSQVVDPVLVRDLPLAGRDVYTILVLQPGVTNDTTTLRGLGLSVNGQRPSASNYLLDGLENNNYLLSGPLTTVAPEAVQEYRVSTNNFSAEYGRTSGFLANAVTRSGTNHWHGIGYLYAKNEALNANDFERNRAGKPRVPGSEYQQGFQFGGPLLPNRVFASTAVEYLRSRSFQDPVLIALPTSRFIESLPRASQAYTLLSRFRPPVTGGDEDIFTAKFQPPSSVDRVTALERVDYVPGLGSHRLLGRLSISRLSRPDFIWSPYKDFVSGLDQNATSFVLSDTRSWIPSFTTEIRAGVSFDRVGWDRAHPEMPLLLAAGVMLPGSPARYAFGTNGHGAEVVANLLLTKGAHYLKTGGGLLHRWSGGVFTTPYAPFTFTFSGLAQFALNQPSEAQFGLAREEARARVYQSPSTDRAYSYRQYFFFIQDSVRVKPRLVLHYGARYDLFGSPHSTGVNKDWLIALGAGDSLAERLMHSRLAPPGTAGQKLYDADHNDWAARVGFAFNVRPTGRTVLRGSFGAFYDRPFDNLWQNVRLNDAIRATARVTGAVPLNFTEPLPSLLQRSDLDVTPDFEFGEMTMYQPGFRTPYVNSLFLGLQHRIADNWSLELNYAGSFGRKLLTTDIINRFKSLRGVLGSGRYNPMLADIDYRANQGSSSYNALIAMARYRFARGEIETSYSWSHAIDNQSEPLAGFSANLEVTSLSPAPLPIQRSAFTRQFDSRVDRGNSDFDQRHNLVLYSVWDVPALFASTRAAPVFRNWKIAQLGALRSGSPYTVFSSFSGADEAGQLIYNRARLVDPSLVYAGTGPYCVDNSRSLCGKRIINPAAFADAGNAVGSSGRNAFHGPGLFNIDLSLSRSVALRWLGESGKLTIRGDAFNVLNHANLNNLEFSRAFCCADDFGVAFYGRHGRTAGQPVLTPLNETARNIQLMLQISF